MADTAESPSAAASAADADTGALRPHTRLVALVVASASFMAQLDSTVLTTALPAMAEDLGTTPLSMNLALTSYLIGAAVFIPVSGQLADRYGARNIFRAAILLFTLASVLCSFAPSLEWLVAARLLQGVGGAMMAPVGRLLVLRTARKSELVAAMAWVMMPAMVGPVVGPLVGGWFTLHLSWHWIFYVNVPIGLLAVALSTAYIGTSQDLVRRPIDLVSLLLSTLALGSIVFGLELGNMRAIEAPAVLALLLAGTIAGAAYCVRALRQPSTGLDLRLLQIETFRISAIDGILYRIGFGAIPFLLPLMLQLVFGYSALESGLITFVSAVGGLAMKFVTPPILRAFGFRSTLVWNGLLGSIYLATSAAFHPGWPVVAICMILFLGGFSRSLQMNAYGTVAFADIPPERMSGAVALFTTLQQVSSSLGIAVAAFILGVSARAAGNATPLMADFSLTFLVLAFVTLGSIVSSIRLPYDAGAEVSNHVRAKR